MKHHIYADNAATTKLDMDAFEAMKPYLLDEYGNASQPYSFSRSAKKALADARAIIASDINALPEEIYFTSGGTESDNWAIKGVALSQKGNANIITSAIEHHAILNSCKTVEKMGCHVEYLQPNNYGTISVKALSSSISNETNLVSIMLSNNEIGTIQPIKDLVEIAHANGSIFHTDAVQSVGHIPINVKQLGVDMLSASAHKFNGPKGIGFLYIKKGTELATFNDGGSQEFGKRAGTENIASIVGMAVALKNNCEKISENQKHILNLENVLLSELSNSNIDFQRNGDPDNHVPGNISLSFKNSDGEMLLHRLDLMGICVSTGSACDSVNTQVSHILRAIQLDKSYAEGTIRISLGKDNTEEEAIRIASAIKKILA